MTDYQNNPDKKVDVLPDINEKIKQALKQQPEGNGFEAGFIQWNSGSHRHEIWDGVGWGELTPTYNINVSTFNGQPATFYQNADNINAGTVPRDHLPDASTSEQGIVRLSSLINSDSETQAASSKAVKLAVDTLNARDTSIASVTGLQTALNAKAPTSHTHTIANISGLQTALNNINSSTSPSTHIIDSSRSLAKPSGVTFLLIQLVGGGHPGGNLSSSHGEDAIVKYALFPVNTAAATLTITIGAPGNFYQISDNNGDHTEYYYYSTKGGNSTVTGAGITMAALGAQNSTLTPSFNGFSNNRGSGGTGSRGGSRSGNGGATSGGAIITFFYGGI